jgi:hypothetical protein
MPDEALELYRRAFAEMVQGAKFREEISRLNLDLDPQSGSEVAKIVAGMVAAPPAIVAKVKTIADEGR